MGTLLGTPGAAGLGSDDNAIDMSGNSPIWPQPANCIVVPGR